VVPIYAAVSWPNLDWIHYLSLWETLSPDMKRVGELVGVDERFIVRAMRGTVKREKPKEVKRSVSGLISSAILAYSSFLQMRALAIHQRFYTAMALHDLVNEVSLQEVSKKYGASKGTLSGLLTGDARIIRSCLNALQECCRVFSRPRPPLPGW
jgi:DNA polymerase theta